MAVNERIGEPGVYRLSAEGYHADPCSPASLSSGGARKLIADVPARYWHERGNPAPPSPALVFGSAAHEWLLEGERWPQRHHVTPEGYDGRRKAWAGAKAEAEVAEDDGMRVISTEQFATIKAMRDALQAHPLAVAAFTGGEAELSLFWRDDDFGIWCRCRPDYLPQTGRIFADYKTTESLRDDDLRRSIARWGYHMQAAWYADGITALGLAEDPVMLFVFQEKTPPYLVRCVTISAPAMIKAELQNAKAREIFAQCLATGDWPGYPDEIKEIDLPAWEHARLGQLEAAGAFDLTGEIRSAA